MVATAAIFAEILIAGFEALAWLSLLLFALTDLRASDLAETRRLGVVGATALLLLAYTLGVLVDRACDSLLQKPGRRFSKEGKEADGSMPLSTMRLWILHQSPGISQFTEYIRIRLRISRATALNLLLLLVAALLVAARQAVWGGLDQATLDLARYAAVVAALLLPLAVFAWLRISSTYYARVKEAYALLNGPVRA